MSFKAPEFDHGLEQGLDSEGHEDQQRAFDPLRDFPRDASQRRAAANARRARIHASPDNLESKEDARGLRATAPAAPHDGRPPQARATDWPEILRAIDEQLPAVTALAAALRAQLAEVEGAHDAQRGPARGSYDDWPAEAQRALSILLPDRPPSGPRHPSAQLAQPHVDLLERSLEAAHDARSWLAVRGAGHAQARPSAHQLARHALESLCLAVGSALQATARLAPVTRPSEAHAIAAEVERHRARLGAAQYGHEPASLRLAIAFATASAAPSEAPAAAAAPAPAAAAPEPTAAADPQLRQVAAAIESAPRIELPHRVEVSAALGGVDLSNVHAHLDASSTSALDASAYTTTAPDGAQHIVFAETPSLATVTHEATHVLQQRAGLVPVGLGATDSTFEHEAAAAAAHGTANPTARAGNHALAGGLAAPSRGGFASPVQREPKAKPQESLADASWRELIGEASTDVARPGRIDEKEGRNLRAKPAEGAPLLGHLPFGTRVMMLRETNHGWLCVQPLEGPVRALGFMAKTAVAEEPVGYDARLVWVQAGQSVSEFVHRQYPNSAGALAMLSDRPFVQALVKLNAKRDGLADLGIELTKDEKESRGEDKQETVRAYKSARLVKNTAIWVPSDAQVLAMLEAGEITTGSQDLLKVVGNVPAHAAYAAGFLVGVPQGLYSAASDLLSGIPDVFKFLGELFAKIYQVIDEASIDVIVDDFEKLGDGLKAGAGYLAKQWNQPGHFARGEFHGKVIAYVLFQIALATVVPQLAANPGKFASVFKAVAAVDKYSGALDLSVDALGGLRKVNAVIKGGTSGGGVVGDAFRVGQKVSRVADAATHAAPRPGIFDALPRPKEHVDPHLPTAPHADGPVGHAPDADVPPKLASPGAKYAPSVDGIETAREEAATVAEHTDRAAKSTAGTARGGLVENKFPDHPVGAPIQTYSPGQLSTKTGRINYVVTEDGTLVLGRRADTIGGGHIDLAGGRPVQAAGELKVVQGRISYVDNASGHYMPHGASAKTAAEGAFSRAGIDISGKYVEKVWNGSKWVAE